MSIYWIGYIITFLVLYNCRTVYTRPQMLQYLHDMGIITPFKCANRSLLSALLQSIIWPWPFFMIALILAVSPLLIIYVFFKK
jgi:hypothetical protein